MAASEEGEKYREKKYNFIVNESKGNFWSNSELPKSSFHVSAPVFVEPQREIRCPTDLTKWEKSQVRLNLINFVVTLKKA